MHPSTQFLAASLFPVDGVTAQGLRKRDPSRICRA